MPQPWELRAVRAVSCLNLWLHPPPMTPPRTLIPPESEPELIPSWVSPAWPISPLLIPLSPGFLPPPSWPGSWAIMRQQVGEDSPVSPNPPRDATAIFPVPAPINTQRCCSPRGQEPLGQRPSCFSLLSSLLVPQPMLPHICLERPGPGRSLLLSEPVPHTASVLIWKTSALATLAILRMYYPIFYLKSKQDVNQSPWIYLSFIPGFPPLHIPRPPSFGWVSPSWQPHSKQRRHCSKDEGGLLQDWVRLNPKGSCSAKVHFPLCFMMFSSSLLWLTSYRSHCFESILGSLPFRTHCLLLILYWNLLSA